jgi:MoaA/NifB/PqqE/SkfB family radical SAM enzyme
MAQVVVWGGEPLLRQDLPELLLAARRAGLFVTLITNGWFLTERWPALRGIVDALILSLDDTDDAHDRLRGLPGLFARLEAFAAGSRGDPWRPTLLLNTVLSVQNRGALQRVAEVARRWEAGLYFCPMETGELRAGEAGDRLAALALPPEELREAARLALELKAAGYPLLSSRAWLELLRDDPALTAYTCRAPRARLTVGADGAVRDCMHVDRPLAGIPALRAAGGRLTDLFRSPAWRRMATEAAACTKCNNPDVVELSWLWDLRPAMLGKVAELAGR